MSSRAVGLVLAVVGANFATAQDRKEEKPQALAKVTIGVTATGRHLPIFVAREKGYFAEAGLDAELKTWESEREMVAAFLDGKVDAATISSVDAFAIEAKSPGTLLFLTTQYDRSFNFVLPKDSPVKSYDDLKGRRIATRRDNGAVGLLKVFLKRKLGSPDAATIVEMDFAAIEKGIDDKSLDAAFLSDYHVARFWDYERLSSHPPLEAVWCPIFNGGCVVRRGLLKKDEQAVRRLCSALYRAVGFMRAGREESSLLAVKYTGFSEDIHRRAMLDYFNDWRGSWSVIGSEVRTRLQAATKILELLRDAGAIQRPKKDEKDIDISQMFYALEKGGDERK